MKHAKTKFITLTQVLSTGNEDKSIKEVPTILNIEGIVYAMQTKLEMSGPVIIGQSFAPLVTRVFITTGQSFAVVESAQEIDIMVQMAQAEEEPVKVQVRLRGGPESHAVVEPSAPSDDDVKGKLDVLSRQLEAARQQRVEENERQKASTSIIKP